MVDIRPEGEGENLAEQTRARHMVDKPRTHDPDPWGVVDSPAEGEGEAHIEQIPDIEQIPIGHVLDMMVGPVYG